MAELVWEGKYDKDGNKVAPLRVQLPFQTVETVNESAQERQRTLDLFSSNRPPEWRNRLIWGDKKYVLPALLEEFAGQVNLIYIDPPFNTGQDFSYHVGINGEEFTKEPSIIEQKAYRDTWGVTPEERATGKTHIDKYLQWFHETIVLLYELLADTGSLFVHVDWNMSSHIKAVLEEVFGKHNCRNEIVWWYYNKLQGNVGRFPANHDTIFWFSKGEKFVFNELQEKRDEVKRQQKRVWDGKTGSLKQARDEDGNLLYYDVTTRTIDSVWRLPYLMPADQTENVGFETQKPARLVRRVMLAASNEGDLILDCFCGSGTTLVCAENPLYNYIDKHEKLVLDNLQVGPRRWIGCDLGRFAIHTTRKRLLSIPGVRPFVVQNLGKYERQLWQALEFGEQAEARILAYRRFILELYHAQPVTGYTWLHGVKAGRMVHVGAVDSPVSPGDVAQIAAEFKRAVGTGKDAPVTNGMDVLGWDFAFELNEVAKQQAAQANINMRFLRIPREVLEKKAVEQGDIRFFELAALAVETEQKGRTVTLKLNDFIIPPDDVPEDVRKAITHWEQWIDYWAVDWNNRGDTFHNEWQDYRTRKKRELQRVTSHTYEQPSTYIIVVKVIDILGNDTTKTIKVEVR